MAELVGTEYPLVRLLLLAVAIINVVFGGYVYRQRPGAMANRVFAAFTGSVALWSLGLLFIRTASAPPILDRLAYVGASLLILCLLLLGKTLAQRATLRGQWDLTVLTVVGTGYALLSFTPLIYRESVFHDGHHQNVYGPLYPTFGIYVLACFAAFVVTLWRGFRRATGLARLQLQYLLLALISAGLGIITTNLVIPMLVGTSAASSYGPLFTIPMIGVIAHTIIRHRLMDIRIIVRDGTVYVLTGLLLAALAVALVIAVDLWVTAPVGRLIMITVVVGTVAILAAPLRDRLHRLLNRYVYRERHEYHQVVREAMERLGQLRHLDSLVTDLCTAVDRTVRPEAIELWLPSPDGSAYRLASQQGRGPASDGADPERLAADSALMNWLTRHPQPFLLDDPAAAGPDGQRAVAELAGRGGELAIPISGDRGLAGLLLIGPKRSGDAYFDEDLALLGALTAEAGVALANARLHQDVMRAREQIEGILETMPSAVVAVSRHGRVEWFNDAAARLTGVSRESVRGRELPGSHPLARLLRDTLADGQPRQEEVALADGRGPAAHLVCSAAPLRNLEGEIQGAVCVGSDLSRVKELEAETRRVERLATFGAMASGIAHEIRNPLVAIKTHIQLMPEGCTCAAQEEQRQFATVATREIYRIDALLDRLMEVREVPRASFAPLDLRDVVQETLLLVQATLVQDGVTLVQGLERDCWVRGDREQLKQLCLNLVVNAKEAVSANGEVHVRCWVRPNRARPTVALEVSDTGPGIAEAVREIVFEPFITTKRHGTGLGLALCRAIADVHRGTIRAENRTPGPGAVFTVEIPAETASR